MNEMLDEPIEQVKREMVRYISFFFDTCVVLISFEQAAGVARPSVASKLLAEIMPGDTDALEKEETAKHVASVAYLGKTIPGSASHSV